jgi:transposase
MRGRVDEQPPLFHVFNVEERIRPDHPLRDIKRRVDAILDSMSPQFAAAYSQIGRPGVPPERLLKALLLMALYSVRSERQLCDRLATDLLFRWFIDLQPSEEAFDPTTFTHNRQRLDDHTLTGTFFDAVVGEAVAAGLCSEHFSVDGTLIESFASAKSFRPLNPEAAQAPEAAETAEAVEVAEAPEEAEAAQGPEAPEAGPGKFGGLSDNGSSATPADPRPTGAGGTGDANGFKPRNPEVDFHGQKRTNATHRSRTDPESRLYRKGRGKEAKLSHMGHALGENRHGLIVGVTVTEASGTAERTAALDLVDRAKATHRIEPKTLGTDKGYDDGEFLQSLEARGIEPHVPVIGDPREPEKVRRQDRPKAGARRRMKDRLQTEGYRLSQKCRKKIEEVFGWLKGIAGLGRSRVVGRWKLRQLYEIGAAAYNLVRLRTLKPAM